MKNLPPQKGKLFLEHLRCAMNRYSKTDKVILSRSYPKLRPLIALYEDKINELRALQKTARRLLRRYEDEEEHIHDEIVAIIDKYPNGIYTASIYRELGFLLSREQLFEWLRYLQIDVQRIKHGIGGPSEMYAWFPLSADIDEIL